MSINLHNKEAEQQLLGLLIKNSKLVSKVLGILQPTDFYSRDNQFIFSSILRSFEDKKNTDPTTLISYLEEFEEKDSNDWIKLLKILVLTRGIDTDIDLYIEAIKDKSDKRYLKKILESQVDLVSKKEIPVENLVRDIEGEIFKATRNRELNDFISIKEATNEFTDDISKPKNISSISSGFKRLDDIVGSYNKGDFIIVAARPSMGKTAFSLELAKNIGKNNNVAYFSIEMPRKSIVERLISSSSMISSNKIRNPSIWSDNEKESIQVSIDTINELKLFIDDSPNAELGEITWKARKLKDLGQLDIIIIDYLGLITTTMNGRRVEQKTAEVSEISRQLKSLARELEIPIIVLSQLNRSVEKRGDSKKIPLMSDLRDSGSIEQDADVVMFLYRDSYYEKKEVDSPADDLLIRVSKNRNGSTGDANLKFSLESGRIWSEK